MLTMKMGGYFGTWDSTDFGNGREAAHADRPTRNRCMKMGI